MCCDVLRCSASVKLQHPNKSNINECYFALFVFLRICPASARSSYRSFSWLWLWIDGWFDAEGRCLQRMLHGRLLIALWGWMFLREWIERCFFLTLTDCSGSFGPAQIWKWRGDPPPLPEKPSIPQCFCHSWLRHICNICNILQFLQSANVWMSGISGFKKKQYWRG